MKMIVPSPGQREMYDLKLDPGELDNLGDKSIETAQELEERLETWQRSFTPRKWHRPTGSDFEKTISPTEMDALRALGYVR